MFRDFLSLRYAITPAKPLLMKCLLGTWKCLAMKFVLEQCHHEFLQDMFGHFRNVIFLRTFYFLFQEATHIPAATTKTDAPVGVKPSASAGVAKVGCGFDIYQDRKAVCLNRLTRLNSFKVEAMRRNKTHSQEFFMNIVTEPKKKLPSSLAMNCQISNLVLNVFPPLANDFCWAW